MSKKIKPEFSYNEKTGLYRKRIKDVNTGKWVDVYGHTRAETRQKVQAKLAEMEDRLNTRENPKVFEYAAVWYRQHTARLEEKSRQVYRNAINNHICPVIGDLYVSEVRWSDIMSVMGDVASLSKSSQQKIVAALRGIFGSAVKDRIIKSDPTDGLKPAGYASKEKEALTKSQQETLLKALEGTSCLLPVQLMLYTGMRREEALGLCWEDVHLDGDAPYLEVKHSCSWEGKNKPVFRDLLKSEAAFRSIPIPPPLVDALREQLPAASPYVLHDKEGKLLSATAFRRRWDAITVRSVRPGHKLGEKIKNHPVTVSIDFHVSPHLLRHTYISELILAGVNIKTVQYLAGHASPEITLRIYTHLMENRPEDLIGEVLKAFPGGKAGGKDVENSVENVENS